MPCLAQGSVFNGTWQAVAQRDATTKKVDYFIYSTSKYLLQSNITFALDLRELNIDLFEKMKWHNKLFHNTIRFLSMVYKHSLLFLWKLLSPKNKVCVSMKYDPYNWNCYVSYFLQVFANQKQITWSCHLSCDRNDFILSISYSFLPANY